MPTCQHCNETWNWKQTMKSFFTLDTGWECPICGETQYPTAESTKRFNLCTFIPISGLLLNFFNAPGILVIGTFLGSTILLICMYPFIIRLSNEEEMPW